MHCRVTSFSLFLRFQGTQTIRIACFTFSVRTLMHIFGLLIDLDSWNIQHYGLEFYVTDKEKEKFIPGVSYGGLDGRSKTKIIGTIECRLQVLKILIKLIYLKVWKLTFLSSPWTHVQNLRGWQLPCRSVENL